MDGSQLLTDRTHLNVKTVSGVSDSKMRDDSFKQNGTASKKGPMGKNVEDAKVPKIAKNVEESKKVDMAEKAKSSTVG